MIQVSSIVVPFILGDETEIGLGQKPYTLITIDNLDINSSYLLINNICQRTLLILQRSRQESRCFFILELIRGIPLGGTKQEIEHCLNTT